MHSHDFRIIIYYPYPQKYLASLEARILRKLGDNYKMNNEIIFLNY